MNKGRDKRKYCFDTNTLTDSWRTHYRPIIFKELWDQIGAKIEAGLILIPKEVRKEIGAGNDPLISWIKKYDSFIIPISEEQIEIATEIVNKYPLVSQYRKPRANHADPFVVAVAKIYECSVVTFEKRNGSPVHPAIPDLCQEHGINCCSIADFFNIEGWHFDIKK